jgi:hypothetical protein
VPFVECQHVERLVPAREDDNRRVRDADVEVAVGLDDLVGDGDVAAVERFEPVGPVSMARRRDTTPALSRHQRAPRYRIAG